MRQIRSIYANAYQVLAWLGEPEEDTDKAMDVLLHLSESGCNYVDFSAHIESTDNHEDVFKLLNLCKPVIAGIGKLLNRPWWNRIWIVQETSVATQHPLAGCGWKWIPIDIFMVVKLSLWTDRKVNDRPLPMGLSMVNLMVQEDETVSQAWCQQLNKQKKSARPSLANLLTATNRRDASDPRDKVFAVIGLSQSQNIKSLLPDYSLHVSEVYQRAMLEILSTDMKYLYFVLGGEKIQLPSWCADFSTTEWYNRTHEGLSFAKVNARASGSLSQPAIFHDTIKNGIVLDGVTVGTVRYSHRRDKMRRSLEDMDTDELTEVIHTMMLDVLNDMLAFTIKSWHALHSRLGHNEACKVLARGDVWRTVLGGEGLKNLDERAGCHKSILPEDYSLVEKFVLKYLPSWASTSRHWSHLVPDTVPANFQESMNSILGVIAVIAVDCTFITTDTGYIGSTAGSSVQDDDIVVVFLGSNFPHVLRRVSETSYKIISLAWVHGIMDGELMEDVDLGDIQKFFLI